MDIKKSKSKSKSLKLTSKRSQSLKPTMHSGGFVLPKKLGKPMLPGQSGGNASELPVGQPPKHPGSQMGGNTDVQLGKLMKGGSPASDLVMDSTTTPPVMNDYIAEPRIRGGGSVDNSLNSLKSQSQHGGSPSSDLVMEQLKNLPQTKGYAEGWAVKGNMNSLNTYKTTGGARKRKCKGKKSKSRSGKSANRKRSNKYKSLKNKSKNNKKSNSRKSMRGGASDWMSSQYSQGPINNPEHTTGMFSHSLPATRGDLNMPPNLGSAGSGGALGDLEGANVMHVGAPVV